MNNTTKVGLISGGITAGIGTIASIVTGIIVKKMTVKKFTANVEEKTVGTLDVYTNKDGMAIEIIPTITKSGHIKQGELICLFANIKELNINDDSEGGEDDLQKDTQ